MPGRKPAPSLLDLPTRPFRIVGRLVRRAVRPPGAAPGTLMASGPPPDRKVRLTATRYDVDGLEERELPDADAVEALRTDRRVTWVNIDGLHDLDAVRRIGDLHGWHPLVMEDVTTPGQRAKVEEHDGYVYVVLHMLTWDAESGHVAEEQLSLILGDGYVVTFQEREGDIFDPVRERIRSGRGTIRRRGADYLAYALIDAVVDHYFHVLEAIGNVTEDLEEHVLVDPDRTTMRRLHALKRELVTMRRFVWPAREALGSLHRSETPRFAAETRVFLRDVYDHAVQSLETVEGLRDVVSGMVDLYLSNVGFRTNEVMKVLTIMASIFIPLSFLAGLYGMNFDHMPELHWPWGYPALLALMLTVAAGMLVFFRRRGWL